MTFSSRLHDCFQPTLDHREGASLEFGRWRCEPVEERERNECQRARNVGEGQATLIIAYPAVEVGATRVDVEF